MLSWDRFNRKKRKEILRCGYTRKAQLAGPYDENVLSVLEAPMLVGGGWSVPDFVW